MSNNDHPQSQNPAGNILKTLSLYSEECLLLLKSALEVAEASGKTANATNNKPSVYRCRYADSSSSDEDGGAGHVNGFDVEPSSTSSQDDNNDGEDEEDADVRTDDNADDRDNQVVDLDDTTTGVYNEAGHLKKRVAGKKGKKKRKPASKEIDQKQRATLIQKHVDTLATLSLTLSPAFDSLDHDESKERRGGESLSSSFGQQYLDLPMSLLSKDERHRPYSSTYTSNEEDSPSSLKSVCQSYMLLAKSLSIECKPVIVLFLRSGRFAGGVFVKEKCVTHRARQHYTTRKGQGKAQSSQDSSGRRPKSMGAQLRRAGEISLQQDVTDTMYEWKEYIQSAAVILLSCPKTMKKGIFENGVYENVINRNDPRIRGVPLDLGRPTYDNVLLIHQVLMTVTVRETTKTVVPPQSWNSSHVLVDSDDQAVGTTEYETPPSLPSVEEKSQPSAIVAEPLTALHVAAKNGDLQVLRDMLENQPEDVNDWIDRGAGEDFMTPLHYAAQCCNPKPSLNQSSVSRGEGVVGAEGIVVDPMMAADCVSFLLLDMNANPCILDSRMRPPYFCALHDKVRTAFRTARAMLGEDAWSWDEVAKVDPPLTNDDIQMKKSKGC